MNTVKVRNVEIGIGKPKMIVPIVGVTKEDILKEAQAIRQLPCDVVEWRIDWFEHVFDIEKLKECAGALKESLGDLPVLMTFRTKKEGGEKEIDNETYKMINNTMAASGLVDVIDVEIFTGDEAVTDMIGCAHENNVKVIASNHDFFKTPAKSDIIYRLRKMQDMGADILKIAVMPQHKSDVLTLLEATEEMVSCFAHQPVVTMSMGGMGVISRLCGEAFGSSMTFGAAKKASAPGQMGVEDLAVVLEDIHKAS